MDRQFFLDPKSIHPQGEPLRIQIPIPPALRALSAIPNAENMRAGDLVLFASLDDHAGAVADGIKKVQSSGGYSDQDARWSHAAVYLGFDFRICEATRSGVRAASLLDYTPTHLIRVRRDPHLELEAGWKISVLAACQIGTAYGFGTILTLARRAVKGYWSPNPQTAHAGDGKICSELYSDCYAAASGRTLWNNLALEATPAYLSATAQLSDVEVGWRPL